MREAAAVTEIRCPLCGSRFQEGEATACAFCRRRPGCAMTACPRCGHEFPRVPPTDRR